MGDFFFQRSQSWVNSLPSPLDSLEFVSLIDANLRPFPSRSIIKNFHITPRIKNFAFKFINLILAKLFKRRFNLPFEFCGASVKDFCNEKCHYHLLIPIATKYFLLSVSPVWVKPVWGGINQKYWWTENLLINWHLTTTTTWKGSTIRFKGTAEVLYWKVSVQFKLIVSHW